VYKELPRLPDFQLIVAEEVPVEYLSRVRILAGKRKALQGRGENISPREDRPDIGGEGSPFRKVG